MNLRNIARVARQEWRATRARRAFPSMVSGSISGLGSKSGSLGKPKVLFVTSNGAGMGHLTRCLAIATSGAASFESSFITLSTSAPIIERFGFRFLQFQSHGSSNLSSGEWNARFEAFMDEALREYAPDAIVFDGTWIYRGLMQAAKRSTAKFVWLRRGLWKPSSNIMQLEEASKFCSLIITPRDIAEGLDEGPLSQRTDFVSVPAITLTSPDSVLSASEAKEALGLERNRRYALIQLGAGNINDIASLRSFVVSHILKSDPDVVPVVAISPLAVNNELVAGDAIRIQQYPIAQLSNAFEFVATAAGYNSVHEAARFHLPGLVIPNMATGTDDQYLRAMAFQEQGFGYMAQDLAGIEDGLNKLLDPRNRISVMPKTFIDSNSTFDSGQGAAMQIINIISIP